MLVAIVGILATVPGGFLVRFSSALGHGVAEWRGDRPREGEGYHVEIDIPRVLEWGKDITPADGPGPSVSGGLDAFEIVGVVEAVEEDGAAWIRVGESIVLVATRGRPCEAGCWARVCTRGVALYDESI